jgi:hypothetical protein
MVVLKVMTKNWLAAREVPLAAKRGETKEARQTAVDESLL